MPGLLERARLVREVIQIKLDRRNGDNKSSDSASAAEDGVSRDEREKLTSEIDNLFTGRKMIEEFGTPEYTARHKGIALPLLVNVIALIVLATGVLSFRYVLASFKTNDNQTSSTYTTSEGLVVQAVREQAETALNERDARIAAVQQELDRLRRAPPGSAAQSAVSGAREEQLIRELGTLRSEASGQLSVLSSQQREDSFLLRQLRSLYQNVQLDISANNVQSALEGVSAADRLLTDATRSVSERLATLIPAGQAGNAAIREALMRKAPTQPVVGDTGEQSTKSAELAAKSAEIVRLTAQVGALTRTIEELRSSIARQNAEMAASQRNAAASGNTINEQAGRLSNQSAQIERLRKELAAQKGLVEAQSQQLGRLLDAARQGLHDLEADTKTTNGSEGNGAVLDLLNTKVIIREAAETEAVQKQFPGLANKLTSFFEDYGRYFSEQGRRAALSRVNATLQRLDSVFAETSYARGSSN